MSAVRVGRIGGKLDPVMLDGHESSAPQSLDEIRNQVSFRRWRIYESVRRILADIELRIVWEKLYDVDAEIDELLSWGLFLEDASQAVAARLRRVFDDDEPPESSAEQRPEELKDHLGWGSRQIEGSVRQSVAVLSREMVSLLTGGRRNLSDDGAFEKKRTLAMPIAEVAGKLRSDLRKLTAFLISDGLWDPDDVEMVLFPEKRAELERGRELKERLVEAMEGFQGSDERLPVSQVLRLWRSGQALGQAALAEIDLLIQGLLAMLDREARKALYVDSYYRLSDWIRHLEHCSEGLKEHLGNEEVEDELIKRIAAILDAEILAEILGEESLKEIESKGGLGELFQVVTRSELRKLDLKRFEENRILELKAAFEAGESDAPVSLAFDDEALLRLAAGNIRGKKMVDRLRLKGALPASMADLEQVQALVLAAEDGLKTYLTLLYGQIQNRDLHMIEARERDVPLAEKRLAVAELQYRLSHLDASESYYAFESVRYRFTQNQPIPTEEWVGLLRFLEHLRRVIAPRLERLATFVEVGGVPSDGAHRMATACDHLAEFEEPPDEKRTAIVNGWLETLANLLLELRDVTIIMAPPQTEAEIEDFLNMMG